MRAMTRDGVTAEDPRQAPSLPSRVRELKVDCIGGDALRGCKDVAGEADLEPRIHDPVALDPVGMTRTLRKSSSRDRKNSPKAGRVMLRDDVGVVAVNVDPA